MGFNSAFIELKVKVKIKQSLYIPEQVLRDSRRFRLPDFKTIGT
jgi:hypothetical protein